MRETFQLLERMKAEGVLADYAVTGAVGAIFYVEPFATEDVDVLVNFPAADSSLLVSLEPVFTYLKGQGYTDFEAGNVVVAGWPLQFLPASDALTLEALAAARTMRYDEEVSVRVLSPEHLAAEALKVGRPKDLGRLALLVDLPEFDQEAFRAILQRHGLTPRWLRRAEGLSPGPEAGPKQKGTRRP